MEHTPDLRRQNSATDDAWKQRNALLMKFLVGLQRIFRTELDEFTLKLYTAALVPQEPELLRRALSEGVREWKFFPSIAEILERIPRSTPQSDARRQLREDQRHEFYKKARREGRLQSSPYRSILEPAAQKLIGDSNLSRRQKLQLGVEEPRQLSPEEHDRRIAELQEQASRLFERQGDRERVAGFGAGLL